MKRDCDNPDGWTSVHYGSIPGDSEAFAVHLYNEIVAENTTGYRICMCVLLADAKEIADLFGARYRIPVKWAEVSVGLATIG